MADAFITCPFTNDPCHDMCGLSIWVEDRSMCAFAVAAVKGTDYGINNVPLDHKKAVS